MQVIAYSTSFVCMYYYELSLVLRRERVALRHEVRSVMVQYLFEIGGGFGFLCVDVMMKNVVFFGARNFINY